MFYNIQIGLPGVRHFAPFAMLTTFPRSSPQPPFSHPDSPSLPVRRRGGQPGNSNAYIHGHYSQRVPSSDPTPVTSSAAPLDSSALLESVRLDTIAALERKLTENRLKLELFFADRKRVLPFDQAIKPLRAIGLIIGENILARKTLQKIDIHGKLRRLALCLPALLNWEFVEQNIPSQPVFVPPKLGKIHANLKSEFQGLAPHQGLLLQKNFDSLRLTLDSTRKYNRRKPFANDLLLFEGIFIKLAYGLRWQDLKGKYPLRLCQDFYRTLYRAGFIQSINEQLHWDLNLNGISTLEALVDQGCFTIKGNRVILSPSEKLTWEKLTALFLLQQGFRAQRASQRQVTLARRRRGGYLRLPPLKQSGAAQCPVHYCPPARVRFPFPPFTQLVRPVLKGTGVRKPPAASCDLGVGPVFVKRIAPVVASLRGPPVPG